MLGYYTAGQQWHWIDRMVDGKRYVDTAGTGVNIDDITKQKNFMQ